ncbi:MAG: DoxX family membrane protein, partial [Patescibacteria group bacterium]|nr:DoxX family membrane protein [Patescibacteria group bacterium]
MNKLEKKWLSILRIVVGWLMFYAGITKVLDPEWTAAGYAKSAKSFAGMYQWFAASSQIDLINFVNQWGLTLLGISLILGIGVRLSSSLGAVLMVFYYLPILDFPYVGEHSFIVDEHVIYALTLIFFAIS